MALSYNPKIVTSGLALCVDAANRDSYPGSGTSWRDLSGNGNHVTLVNSPTYNSGNLGSIVLNGSNQYGTTNYSISGKPFSINIWIYTTNLGSSYHTWVGQDTSQATTSGNIYLQRFIYNRGTSPNCMTIGILDVNNTGANATDPNALVANVWYNYCATVDTSTITLYKNGTQVATAAQSTALATTTGGLILGGGYFNNGPTDYCQGYFPHCSVYNRALTAEEVLQNFNALRGRYGV